MTGRQDGAGHAIKLQLNGLALVGRFSILAGRVMRAPAATATATATEAVAVTVAATRLVSKLNFIIGNTTKNGGKQTKRNAAGRGCLNGRLGWLLFLRKNCIDRVVVAAEIGIFLS